MRRSVGKIMYRRVLIVGLSILLQLVVMLATMIWLSDYRQWVQILLSVLSGVSVLYLLYDSANSSYKIAWIILILAFPVAGISIYMTFGGRRLSRAEKRKVYGRAGRLSAARLCRLILTGWWCTCVFSMPRARC